MYFPQRIISNRPVKVAIVGCGRISKNHIKSLLIHSTKATIEAFCDISEENLTKTFEFFREESDKLSLSTETPKKFSNYNDLIDSVRTNKIQLDLVVLTSPSGLHPEQAILAANSGIHVCTEKPMATKWKDGMRMVDVCNLNGVRLFVVKQNRFNSTLQLVKKQIRDGRFGKLSLVQANVFWQRPQEYYDQSSWRGTWDLDGGALMNQASHYIDLLEWLIGPVDTVAAQTATIERNIEAEDTAVLNLRWRNGALGSMAVTMLSYPKNIEGSLTILGSTGSVKIGGPAVNKIEMWQFSSESPDDSTIDQVSYETTSVYGFGHPPYYENMLNCLINGEIPECDGREGLKSLELLVAAYRSARDRSYVSLPLEI